MKQRYIYMKISYKILFFYLLEIVILKYEKKGERKAKHSSPIWMESRQKQAISISSACSRKSLQSFWLFLRLLLFFLFLITIFIARPLYKLAYNLIFSFAYFRLVACFFVNFLWEKNPAKADNVEKR